MTDETAAIRAIIAEQDEAWCAGDAVAFARRAASDIVFTNVMGLFSIGREPFEAQHRHIFATFYKESALRQSIEQISLVQDSVVILNTLTTVTGFGVLPPILLTQVTAGALTTRLEQVLVRTNNDWQIAAFHNVVVHPQARAAAPQL